ncbi:DUF2946 family protein [Pseudoxanthomonas beigongshangi]
MRDAWHAHRVAPPTRIAVVIRHPALFRPLARLALCAILLLALAPAVSRVLGAGTSATTAGWIELCTPGGLKWVDAAGIGGDDAPVPAPAATSGDCAYCPLATSLPWLPLALAMLLPLLPRAWIRPYWREPFLRASIRLRGLGGQGPPRIF